MSGQERDFLTLAGRLDWHGWNLAIAYTRRETRASGSAELEDFQFQTSVGYRFASGLEVNVGWYIANEDHIETNRIGALLAYSVSF